MRVFLLFLLIANISHAYDNELSTSLRCVAFFSSSEYKHRIPRDTLYSISLNETGKKHSTKDIRLAWPWSVNVEGRGYFFDTKKDVIAFVKQQISEGKKSIDVGCMQVNLKNHPDAFRNLNEAFDPRANIAYAASFLRSKYDQLGSWHKAIAHYHSATESLGTKYKNNVINIAADIDKHKESFRRHYREQRKNTQKKVESYKHIAQKAQTNQSQTNKDINNETKRQNYKHTDLDKKQRSNIMVYVPAKKQ